MTKQEAIESKEKNKAIYTGLAIRDTFEDTNRRRKSRHIMSRKQIIIHMLQRGTQCANVVATVIKWRRRRRGGAPCFRIGGAEDNFIFYIEYCFFFVPMIKLR